eukprot:m.198025 g.198025  ORF g.198025 m.198025 type:complete len:2548 (+) comp39552_c0_seq11:586-8229(+)
MPRGKTKALTYEDYPGIISFQSNGFLEQVVSIFTAGRHTVVHTVLADCTLSGTNIYWNSSVLPFSLAAFGGGGQQGLLLYENTSALDLKLSVGDVIIGRPSGSVAGTLVDYYLSKDALFLELSFSSNLERLCHGFDWCNQLDAKQPIFHYQGIIRPIAGSSDVLSNLSIGYWPEIQMTFRSNQSSPFVSKFGFVFDGPIRIGISTTFSNFKRDKEKELKQKLQPALNQQSKVFCIEFSSVCIPGRILFSANYSVSYSSKKLSPFQAASFTFISESLGNAQFGTVWRNGVGFEFIKKAKLVQLQDLSNAGNTVTFDASVTPSFQIEWPATFRHKSYIRSSVPAFLHSLFKSTLSLYSFSSFTVSVAPTLKSHFESEKCFRGCDFNKKLMASLWSGIYQVNGFTSVKLLYQSHQMNFTKWQDSKLMEVKSGLCLPLDDSNECPCECPGGSECISSRLFKDKLCPAFLCGQQCDIGSCPPGTVERVDAEQQTCKCQCSDFTYSDLVDDGKNPPYCQCGCSCPDNTKSVIGPDGSCQCNCKCNNCMDSARGPGGCVCLDDKCPSCREGLEPVWQDCVCSCQSKQGRGGLPPVCSDGWKGPYCDVPDCSPWPFCSDNGKCIVPSGHDADRRPYCACNELWIGPGCHFARPRPGGGDPHLQTLDGFNYDFFDIGEFWYCKSEVNDFGVNTRFFKYERVSLIGAVAVKAGSNVIAITTPHSPKPEDLPVFRLNDVIIPLRDGLQLGLDQDSIHVHVGLFPNKSSLGLISFEFFNGASFSVNIRYSSVMNRQFINILFAPTASFKQTTQGLCGLMDGNITNDLVGSDGFLYPLDRVIDFAKSWRIVSSFNGSGLNGSWSWNHSNFHVDDTMDISYTDPTFVPSYSILHSDSELQLLAHNLCTQRGPTGVRLTQCIFDVAVTNDTSFAEQDMYQEACPLQCSGKGTCVNGTCICLAGWSGDECSIGSCVNCSVNGNCVSGFCKCSFGWEGVSCDKRATCYEVENCTSSRNGRCKSSNLCECLQGFTGLSCNVTTNCSRRNDCSSNGQCVDHDFCKCDYGWAGSDCTAFSCEAINLCGNHGSCFGFDECQCEDGWQGSSCELPACRNVSDCTENGECVAPNTCLCYDGFTGDDCGDAIVCSSVNNCSGNGVCRVASGSESCICYSGYEGITCNVTSCTGRNHCSGNGVCVEVDLCECDYGYSGINCNQYSCEAKGFCSGHGKCLQLDNCTCDAKWNGSDCSIPDCSGVNNCGNSVSGSCIAPDTCECTKDYDGSSCGQLAGNNNHSPKFNVTVLRVVLSDSAPVGYPVATLSAIDLDNGKNGRITYSLSSEWTSLFQVDVRTGKITTASLLIGYSDSILGLTLTAADGGVPPRIGSVLISAKIISINLYCPEFVDLPSSVYINETAEVGSLVLDVRATDKDSSASPNGEVSYSIEEPLNFFEIRQSGRIVVGLNLSGESYALQVAASDKGVPPCHTRKTVLVQFISSNNAPTCIPRGMSSFVPYTVSPGTALFSLNATDIDSGDDGRLSYTTSSFESTILSRNPFLLQSGQNGQMNVVLLSRLANPVAGFYKAKLTVTATDYADNPKSCVFHLTVTVSQPFEFASQFLAAAIPENVTINSVIYTNQPLSINTTMNSSRIAYRLVNADESPFRVQRKSGTITVAKSLDYELQKEYVLEIVALTEDVPAAFAIAVINISLVDVNDNPPQFKLRQNFVAIEEGAKSGRLLLHLMVNDLDSISDMKDIQYEIISDSRTSSEGTFEVLPVADGVNLSLSQDAVLNYQVAKRYNLVIKAWDRRAPWFSDQTIVVILVNDSNAKVPEFLQSQYMFDVPENSPNGTRVGTVEALLNGNSSTQITFLIRNETKTDSSSFTVTSQGIIRISNPLLLDYESIQMFNLTVEASATEPLRRTTTTTVVINLQDANDNRPVFNKDQQNKTVYVDIAKAKVGQMILATGATDKDSGLNGELIYAVTNGSLNDFISINSSTGYLFIINNFSKPALGDYQIHLSAADRGKPSLSASLSVVIQIVCLQKECRSEDSEARDLEFIQSTYIFNVSENSPNDTIVGAVQVSYNGNLTSNVNYSIQSNAETRTAFKVTSEGLVQISSSTLLDYESVHIFNVTVAATVIEPVHLTAMTTVVINIQDLNDNIPVFSNELLNSSVFLDTTKAFVGQIILNASAVDEDSGANGELVYVITNNSLQDYIAINSSTGVVYVFNNTFTKTANGTYELHLTAADQGNPPLSAIIRVFLKLGCWQEDCRNETFKSLKFVNSLYEFDINENLPNGSDVGIVKALLVDSSSAKVNYSIQSNLFEPSAFSVTDEGLIQVSNSLLLDYESVHQINLTVVATTEIDSTLLTSLATVVVNLQDVNDNSPVFSINQDNTPVVDDIAKSAVGEVILILTATDQDSGTNGELVYRMNTSEVLRQFITINSSTGKVFVTKKFTVLSVGEYQLYLTVLDQGKPSLSASTKISVRVLCSQDYCTEPNQERTVQIVGGTVGGIAGFVLAILFIVFIAVLCAKKKNRKIILVHPQEEVQTIALRRLSQASLEDTKEKKQYFS